MQIDRQKFQQCNVEISAGSLPEPTQPGQQDKTTEKKVERRKLHPRAYEDAERWDGMS